MLRTITSVAGKGPRNVILEKIYNTVYKWKEYILKYQRKMVCVMEERYGHVKLIHHSELQFKSDIYIYIKLCDV